MAKPMDVSMAKPMEPKVSMICMVNPMDISMAKAMELKKKKLMLVAGNIKPRDK